MIEPILAAYNGDFVRSLAVHAWDDSKRHQYPQDDADKGSTPVDGADAT